MTPPLRGIDPAHVLSSHGELAYVDAFPVCGVPGIAAAWTDGRAAVRTAMVLDRLSSGAQVTASGRHDPDADVAGLLRRACDCLDGHDQEASVLDVLLPGPPEQEGIGSPFRHGHHVAARSAVRAATVPDAMRDALHAVLDHGVPRVAPVLNLYRHAAAIEDRAPGDRAWKALEFAARNDLVAEILMDRRHVEPGLRPRLDPTDMLRSRWPGVLPAHLRRLRGLGDAGGAAFTRSDRFWRVRMLDALLALPVDRWPADDDVDWKAFRALSEASETLSGGQPRSRLATLMNGSAGRWADVLWATVRAGGLVDFAEQVGTEKAVSRIGSGALDATRSLRDTMLRPLAARAGHAIPSGWGDTDANVLLYGDKGLPAVAETSAAWHAMEPVLSAAMWSGGVETWPPLLAAPFEHGDVTVRCVTDRTGLIEEGGDGPDRDGVDGLHHCVASRLSLCVSGKSHVLSIRSRDTDVSAARLSTCQVTARRDGDSVVVDVEEHRGRANQDPPARAMEAVEAMVEGIARGTVAVVPAALARRKRPREGEVARDCGYDWRDDAAMACAVTAWEPLLPRWARGLGPDGLSAALVARGILPPTGQGLSGG